MEDQIRIAVFQWLREQTNMYGEVLPSHKNLWLDHDRLSMRCIKFKQAG